MRLVRLENIEMRSAQQRSYSSNGEVCIHTFALLFSQLLMREIHHFLFLNKDFDLSEYFRSLGWEPINMNNMISLTEPSNKASNEQRLAHRKWNNAKANHSLRLNAFITWSSPDAVFVTIDKNFLRKRDKLKEPFVLTYRAKVTCPDEQYRRLPGGENDHPNGKRCYTMANTESTRYCRVTGAEAQIGVITVLLF